MMLAETWSDEVRLRDKRDGAINLDEGLKHAHTGINAKSIIIRAGPVVKRKLPQHTTTSSISRISPI